MRTIKALSRALLPLLVLALLLCLVALAWPFTPALAQGGVDYYTIKYQPDGTLKWSKAYDSGDWDEAFAVAVDSESNVIVTGRSNNGENFDYYTIKYDPDGNKLWNASYDSGASDEAWAVAVDKDGNVIVTGKSNNGENFDYYTIKYDKDGTELWNRTYNGGDADEANGVAVDSEDNIIVTGFSNNTGTDNFYTIKYDPDGTELWNRTYDGGDADCANGVAVDSEDNIIVTGYSYDGSTINYCTIKYDTDGNEVWNEPVIYDFGYDQAQAIAVDNDDNIIVTGSSREPGEETKWYFCTIKYDQNGTEVWNKTYHGTYKGEAWNTIAQGAAADSAGDVIITGCYYVPAYAEYDEEGNLVYHMAEYNCYITIKYNSANGTEVWNEPVIYDSGIYDCVHGVAVDSEDNITVTGCSQLYPGGGGGGGLSSAAIAGIAVGAGAGTGLLVFLIRRGWGRGQPAPRAERRREARKAAKKRRKSKQ